MQAGGDSQFIRVIARPPAPGATATEIVLRAGDIQAAFEILAPVLGQIRANTLRAVAVTSLARSPMLPNVPTIAQTLPGFSVVNWFGVVGPKGLAAGLVTTWNGALRAAVAKPDVQKRFVDNGMDTITGSAEELKSTIAADRKKWSDVIQSAGIRAD